MGYNNIVIVIGQNDYHSHRITITNKPLLKWLSPRIEGFYYTQRGPNMNKSYIASEIKNRIKMPEILMYYGIEIDRKNRISCPLHNGKDKNCGVKDDYIHCFVCNESADQISFLQRYFSLSFADAVSKINDDFSLGLPIGERIDKRRQTDMARQSFLRRKEQKAKEQEHEKYLTAWLDAHSEFVRLERQRVEYKPKLQTEELHPKFIEALQNIEYARYRLGCAEEELMRYEKRNG